VNSPKMGIWTF